MRAFYQRLVMVNKRPGKVALIAVMRKMLVTLNAMARDGQPWSTPPASPLDPSSPKITLIADDAPVGFVGNRSADHPLKANTGDDPMPPIGQTASAALQRLPASTSSPSSASCKSGRRTRC
jgi:hypothetical protein